MLCIFAFECESFRSLFAKFKSRKRTGKPLWLLNNSVQHFCIPDETTISFSRRQISATTPHQKQWFAAIAWYFIFYPFSHFSWVLLFPSIENANKRRHFFFRPFLSIFYFIFVFFFSCVKIVNKATATKKKRSYFVWHCIVLILTTNPLSFICWMLSSWEKKNMCLLSYALRRDTTTK